MPDPIVLSAFLGIVAVIAVLFGVALLRRSRRDAGVVLAPIPDGSGALLAEADGQYLATTLAGRPYERAPIPDLFFRAACRVAVHPEGIAVDAGRSFWIPAADLTGAGPANLVIDRVVESGGLTAIGWRAGTLDLESTFRLDPAGADAVIAAVRSLPQGAPASAEETA